MLDFIKYLINRKEYEKAYELLKNGRYALALKKFKNLYENKNMRNFYVELALGKCYLGLGRFDKAYEYFKKSYEDFPINPVPLIGIAQIYFKKKNYIFAYKFLRKALKTDPIHPHANYYAGLCLIAMKKPSLAVKHFERVYGEKKEFLFARLALYFEKNLEIDNGIELGEF